MLFKLILTIDLMKFLNTFSIPLMHDYIEAIVLDFKNLSEVAMMQWQEESISR